MPLPRMSNKITRRSTYIEFDVIISGCGTFYHPSNFVVYHVMKTQGWSWFVFGETSVFPRSRVRIKSVL